jgi:putative transposase
LAAGPPAPTPAALLCEAFRWSQWRTVTKTATVSLHGNIYEVDPALAGARVELVFDPFDLTDIDVRHHGRAVGRAVPHQIGRHVHPKAATYPAPPPTPTGIDYLRLVEDRHTQSLGERLHYAQLAEPVQQTEAGRPAHPGVEDPPPDRDGLTYSSDLLTLAGAPDSTAPDLEETR